MTTCEWDFNQESAPRPVFQEIEKHRNSKLTGGYGK